MNMRVHISLSVADLAASIAFYETLFDQPVTKSRPDYANFRLDEPAIHLALEPANHEAREQVAGEAGTHSHFGIELPDAESFQNWRTRLRNGGAVGRDENDAQCCYAKADKVWMTDPDGNAWEIWKRKAEVEVMREASGCCAA